MFSRHSITLLIYLAMLCQSSMAQVYLGKWIGHPNPKSHTEIWFRQDCSFDEHPLSAIVTVASTGYFELFINERNVSASVLAPYRMPTSEATMTVSYNVNRFLRRGNNTIAVWYAPSAGHANSMQIALTMSGLYADSTRFVMQSDHNWLCKEAPFELNLYGGETLDGRKDRISWKGKLQDVACWVGARECSAKDIVTQTNRNAAQTDMQAYQRNPMKLIGVVRPKQTFMRGDTIVYDFGEGFYGQLRATFRGAKKGERVSVGNLRYTCNGVIDEQVYHKFTANYWRQVYVWGDSRFRKDQVEVMEGLIIAPVTPAIPSWDLSDFFTP